MSLEINWGGGSGGQPGQEDDEPKAPQPEVSQQQLDDALGMGSVQETRSESFKKLESGQAPSVFSGSATGSETVFKKVKQPMGGVRQDLPDPSLLLCIACGEKLVGKFVKIGASGLHSACFNCAVCGDNLKGRGYFQKDGKLYCRKDRPL